MSLLRRLFLSNNELIEIPNEIGQLSQLRELYAHHNKLSYLPDLSQLTYLHVQSNNLVEFPTSVLQLENLKELNLDDNMISEIPEDIDQLTRLKWLSVKNVGSELERKNLTKVYESLKVLMDAGVDVNSNFELVDK